ncbi:MAG: T9SS type A sorting domain-containing protein, partial [Bacteroidales bacterium]
SIDSSINIIWNPSLTDLTGLPAMTTIHGDLHVETNINLASLSGVDMVTSIEGDFSLYNNNLLTDFSDLKTLDSIKGSLIIQFGAFTNFSGLDSLKFIGGGIFVSNCNAFTSFTGLDSITSLGGPLFMQYDSSLVDFTGLGSLKTIGGQLYMEYNPAITNFTGLESLTTIMEDVWINDNDALTSLTGLGNALIGANNNTGWLTINNNDALTSIEGLDTLNIQSLIGVQIGSNHSLTTCAVQPLCDLLSKHNQNIYIYDNGSGCNTKTEVEELCGVVSVEDLTAEKEFSIFPNPANQSIIISSKNGAPIGEVAIYNQVGQKVMHVKPLDYTVDISKLQKGMYFVEVLSRYSKNRVKLIVE